MEAHDAIVVGSGPNGLAAAVRLACAGLSVLVVEAKDEIGGGTRTAELTLPGFRHDVCSAVHPMAALSPFFRELRLEDHGLEWIRPPASVAHPFTDGPAVLLRRSLTETSAALGVDARAYHALIAGFLGRPERLLRDLLAPLGFPEGPTTMARFAWLGAQSAADLARRRFRAREARALFAGCAAHSVQPLDRALTGAFGLVFAITAHLVEWPVARGGSRAITDALARILALHGGQIRVSSPVSSLRDLPPSRAVLFDLAPQQVATIAGDVLPARYVRRLERYRQGPAVFKVDWALDGPIPWRDPACAEASTVHVGGTLEEISAAESAAWNGEHPERPFVLVAQQSLFDPSRSPAGKHTGYAYCHVPFGSSFDMTERIELQLERFAPGFRERVLARHARGPAGFEAYNPSYVGGAVTGGVADWRQLFTRPVARWNPYTTPHPRLFLCSHATPPGGGVHGMCGYHAAGTVLRRLGVGESVRGPERVAEPRRP